MSMEPQGDSAAVEQFAKFANLISSVHLRREFDRDPLATLAKQGVNVDALPEPVRDFLADLSFEELRLLARLQETMVGSGLSVPTAYGSLGHL
jgi:hypothetical protein